MAKKIKDIFLNMPRKLAQNAFTTFLFLLPLVILFSGVIFYQYVLKEFNRPISAAHQKIKFKQENYEKFLKIIETKKNEFDKLDQKTYFDPFSPR